MAKYKGIKKGKRNRVMAKTGGLCWYCGKDADTVDHVIPYNRKHIERLLPRNHVDNLLPACYTCNNKKANSLLSEFRERMKIRFWGERFLPASSEA